LHASKIPQADISADPRGGRFASALQQVLGLKRFMSIPA